MSYNKNAVRLLEHAPERRAQGNVCVCVLVGWVLNAKTEMCVNPRICERYECVQLPLTRGSILDPFPALSAGMNTVCVHARQPS